MPRVRICCDSRTVLWVFTRIALSLAVGQASHPQVVIVVMDDMSNGDLSCHGSPHIQTPHLDALYASGARFTDFHVAPMCSPTRGQLLFWLIDDVHPADRWVLLEAYGKIGAMIGFAGGWAWCGTLAARQFWHSSHLPSEGSPLRFGVWFVALLVIIVGTVIWLFIPAPHINAKTCTHIRPGMAEEEVYEIVGAPPGWYDGVGGISSGAPFYIGDESPN